MGIDRLDGDDPRLPATHDQRPDVPNDRELRPPDAPSAATESDRRAEYYAEYRAKVDAEYRAAAVDHGCDQVRETERNLVTPEIRRIEAEDPDRQLVGFEFRLKGKDRLTEKVTKAMDERNRTPDEAFATVKDAIRYTFQYTEEHYTAGVRADCDRLEAAGFQSVDRNNSWEDEEYKGINSRWRVPEDGQLFEVQFHTEASFEAKQETHMAYERLRDSTTPDEEVHELRAFQREISAKVPIPPGAADIPNRP